RPGGFFLDTDGAPSGVELDDAVAFRITHAVGEDRGALGVLGGAAQVVGQVVAVEDIVAQDERARGAVQEVTADDEGLGDPFGCVLYAAGERQTPLVLVPQEHFDVVLLCGGGDVEDPPDHGQHQRGQGVVVHRLVVDRQ